MAFFKTFKKVIHSNGTTTILQRVTKTGVDNFHSFMSKYEFSCRPLTCLSVGASRSNTVILSKDKECLSWQNKLNFSIQDKTMCKHFSLSSLCKVTLTSDHMCGKPLGIICVLPRKCYRDGRNNIFFKRTMAGHSKWQNIRHTKAAKDQARATEFSRLSLKMRSAIRETNNPDPETNTVLARLISEGRGKDMPNSILEGILKGAAAQSKTNLTSLLFEARGPSGSALLIDTITDNPKRIQQDMNVIVKKSFFKVGKGGTAVGLFDQKGIIIVSPGSDIADVDMDSILDIAIESGAEEVTKTVDQYGEGILEFVCDKFDLYTVKKELEDRNLNVKSAEIQYIPHTMATFSQQYIEAMEKLVEKLNNHPEVVRLFDNVQAEESPPQ